jgi:hypothetical protein
VDGAIVTYSASASDLVTAYVEPSCLPASGSLFPVGSTLVTCSATDDAGNLARSSFTVSVGSLPDTSAPTIAAHADVTTEATGPAGATVGYTPPTATDVADGSVAVSCLPAPGALFPLGSTTVSCSAQDSAGNSTTLSFSVIVRDTTPPTIAAHADVTAEASGSSGATVAYVSPTAADNLDGPVPVSCLPVSGSLFALGSTTVTCSANDSAGNTASSSFAVLVRDTTSPTIAAHADLTAEATGPSGANVAYSQPAATDAVDGSVPVSCLPASGSLFPIGSTQVTCGAHDAAGNVSGSSFTVHVRVSTPPTIAAHADLSAEATSGAGATVTYSAPTATDAVDGSVPVSCLPASGSVFTLGSTTVSCSVTDAAGNTANSSFAIVVQDTTPPDLQVPGAMSVVPTGPGGAVVTYSATATDLVDGTVSVSCLPASGTQFPLGATDVSCTASDAAGNAASASFSVWVGNGAPPPDTTPPTIAAHSNLTIEATGASGAPVSYTAPTANDAVDGPVAVSCLPASGGLFPLGTTTVTCTSHDAAGNTASSTFTVLVRDTTPPTIAAHSNLTIEATGASGATVNYSAPTATDAVDGTDTVNCLRASGGLFPLGTTTVTCTSHDAAGNTASSTFTVLVRDTTPPTISAHADMTVNATSPSGAVVSFSMTAADIVDGSDTVTCAPASGGTFGLGHTTVTCHAHDAAGNQAATVTFDVYVKDAASQLTDLSGVAAGMNLPGGFGKKVSGDIGAALQDVSNGDLAGANTALSDLISQVNSEAGKPNPKITQAEAAQIVAAARRIQGVI